MLVSTEHRAGREEGITLATLGKRNEEELHEIVKIDWKRTNLTRRNAGSKKNSWI